MPAPTASAHRPRISGWQAALFFVAVSAAAALTARPGRRRAQRAFYRSENLPVWAPPGWVFPLVWPLNNAALVWAGRRLLNAAPGSPHRRALLGLQALLWLDFLTYGWAYFRRRSPVLSAAWTLTDAALALSSLRLARRRGDAALGYAYLPLSAWTGFASTVALYDALRNPDAFFGTPAPLQRPPLPALERAGRT